MSSNPNNAVYSFFAGSGLLDLAFENTGFDVCFVNEFFKPFLDAYVYSRSQMGHSKPRHGFHCCSIDDFGNEKGALLSKYVAEDRSAGKTVGFIGGPPCPDFSIGGKNRGQNGENGKLSQSYIDLIYSVEPDWFVFENVKGLWRTRKHREFYDGLKAKISEKYELVERLTNSIEAGAPQDRDRILLFGAKKGTGLTAHFSWDEGLSYKGRAAFEDYIWPGTESFTQDGDRPTPNSVPKELTVQHWFDLNDVENHPNSSHCFKPRNGLAKFQSVAEGDVSRKSSKRLHRWRYSPTAAYGNNEVHLHPYKARRISVAEALSLQSMPKSFELPPDMSLSNMYKTIGNGVPYLLGLHIARRVNAALEQNRAEKAA